jgi:hypothetical protein
MIENLKNFFNGWVIGDFSPTLFNTGDFEVAIKRYNAGDYEESHFHKIATEYTIIIDGVVLMNNIEYRQDDIITINPNESTDFKCLTDVTTVVIKIPSSKGDKYKTI